MKYLGSFAQFFYPLYAVCWCVSHLRPPCLSRHHLSLHASHKEGYRKVCGAKGTNRNKGSLQSSKNKESKEIECSHSEGGSLHFSMKGVCFHNSGLRFYKKVAFGVCDVQHKKNAIFRV